MSDVLRYPILSRDILETMTNQELQAIFTIYKLPKYNLKTREDHISRYLQMIKSQPIKASKIIKIQSVPLTERRDPSPIRLVTVRCYKFNT
jgi:endonuclease III